MGRKVDYINVKNYAEFKEGLEFIESGKHEYQTLVVDSLSELQQKAMEYILAQGGRDRATIGDWGVNIDLMRKLVRLLRDVDMHVILTSHTDKQKDEEAGIIYHQPAFSGKTLSYEIAGYVDVVGYLYVRDITDKATGQVSTLRKILCNPVERFKCKDRFGKLDKLEEPDFNIFIKKSLTVVKPEEKKEVEGPKDKKEVEEPKKGGK